MTRIWLPPGTASTWICWCGAINPRTSTTCRKKHEKDKEKQR